MTKFIVNNRTDALKTDINLFFTIINCRIARARSLTLPMNFKFICLSAYWPWKLANERAWISAVIVKSSMETELARAVDVVMARAKIIYILIIKVNRKHVLRVSIELYKHLWKFGRTRKSRCGNSRLRLVFPQHFSFSPANFHSCLYNLIETQYIFYIP